MSDERPDGGTTLRRASKAWEVVERARRAGLNLDGVWVVGGVVRDALLDIDSVADVDLAVEGAGVAFAHLLASGTDGDVVAEHDFGTATVLVPSATSGIPTRVDIATCRTETYREPGALPDVSLGASVAADLARRDVSVNAIAIAAGPDDSGVHAMVDPQGGASDLRLRQLRVLHDLSFVDDPTRIFRVARYAGRLGFHVQQHSRNLAVAAVDEGALGTVSADRVRAELELVLSEPAWESLTLLASWGVLEQLEPRLEGAFHPPLILRLLDDACGADPELNRRAWTLRLAALARPLGSDAPGWMRWLGFPAQVISQVAEHISVLETVLEHGAELQDLPNSELYIRLGEVTDDSFALAALAVDDHAPLLERLSSFHAALRGTRLAVRGEDVIAAGVPAGPAVGRILGDLFLRALDGELASESDERRALGQLAEVDRPGADARE